MTTTAFIHRNLMSSVIFGAVGSHCSKGREASKNYMGAVTMTTTAFLLEGFSRKFHGLFSMAI